MSTKKGLWRRAVLGAAVVAFGSVATARADVVTDQGASIIVFPKIRVNIENAGAVKTDTIIEVTNTATFLVKAHCFLINANSHCSNADPTGTPAVPLVCQTNADCNPTPIRGGICQPTTWPNHDFNLTLTKRQPLSWRASEGLANPCPSSFTNEECQQGNFVPLSGGRTSIDGQSNEDTRALAAEEDPFTGELKCIQVDPVSELPFDRNDLKGEATIVNVDSGGGVDAAKYNAIGIQATGFQDTSPTQLTLGGPNPEYNACPSVIILDHFFDTPPLPAGRLSTSAGVETHNDGTGTSTVTGAVATDLIVVPCTEDLLHQDPTPGNATLQFLIYNEFEQRFSTSTRVNCYKEVQLSDIDTRVGTSDNASSIYSAGVQGTLTGQTRIRPVTGIDGGRRVLAIAQERWTDSDNDFLEFVHTTARNLQTIQRQPDDIGPIGLPDTIQITCPSGGAPNEDGTCS
ncbi:MAG: hypothetical protein HYR72_16190 [Deltaproteobacteria bacterium]|nr:hypothetical protein [Deltaproteobacteria bacterium]MBI3389594.1 hypothetical protein [Deltaproteobacteria bacterium]